MQPTSNGAGTPDDVKAQLLGLLLFAEPGDLAREWRVPREQLPAWVAAGPHPALQVCAGAHVRVHRQGNLTEALHQGHVR